MYDPKQDPHYQRLVKEALKKRQAETDAQRKREMEDELFQIEVRRDKRERHSLVISYIALVISILSIVLSLAQWILS